MMIPKPNWRNIISPHHKLYRNSHAKSFVENLEVWFDANIAGREFYDPKKSVRVTGCECIGDRYLYYDSISSEASCPPAKHHTHSALLVNIEPLRSRND